ncbi:hypothetical protein ACSL103130_06415 [Actinomyces slackii]|uniref:Uncharacterized protein n=2 Tax=Actinomyces slackii TaxID=52774 RepID=A0A3S4SJK4_9ACTO|nr:Uncharacterised protein [Actinomyces slackii]
MINTLLVAVILSPLLHFTDIRITLPQASIPHYNYAPPAGMVRRMLHLGDIPGITEDNWRGVETVWTELMSYNTGCSTIDTMLDYSLPENRELRRTSVTFTFQGVDITQTMALDIYVFNQLESFERIAASFSECDGETFQFRSSEVSPRGSMVTEAFTAIPADQLPQGVVGYTSVITAEDGSQRTTQRIVVPVIDEHNNPGLIALSTTTDGPEPADLSPVDLLDAALTRAEVTIDPAALATPTPTAT